jgi:hypothetical protein
MLGEAELLSGRIEDADRHLAEGARLHREIGAAGGEALSLQRLAEARIAGGRASEADPLLLEALDAARLSPLTTRHLLGRIYGARIRAAGDPADATAMVDEAEVVIRGPLETCPFCTPAFAVPAAVACARGRQLDKARGYLGAAEAVVTAFWRRGGWVAALDEVRAHLALTEGDPAAAAVRWTAAADEYAAAGQPLDAERCRQAAGKV